MWQFTSLPTVFLFLPIKFDKIKRRFNSFDCFFSLISLAPCDIFELRFTSRMWNWVRCGSCLFMLLLTTKQKNKIQLKKHIWTKIWIFTLNNASFKKNVGGIVFSRLIYLVMCFNDDWRYRFTRANDFCLLELIWVALGHLDELQKAEKYPIRWSL